MLKKINMFDELQFHYCLMGIGTKQLTKLTRLGLGIKHTYVKGEKRQKALLPESPEGKLLL